MRAVLASVIIHWIIYRYMPIMRIIIKDVDTERFAAGVEFSYPGKYRGVSENEIDLWRPVKREKRILYAERENLVRHRRLQLELTSPTVLASMPVNTHPSSCN